ncbi:VWA domain-containing protein [Mesorhizobium sp. 8]|uniref:vWA domain-containing protein n=1 Tax=Mesorhizobium sp. 8 TaxID=2584466 RepID=UPI001120826A|nr:VWA domain-containing protein [Mesorhizobium sp. 8]QDC00881.1 VWA domain-containing protein [Mesorhizobium sp. 8]
MQTPCRLSGEELPRAAAPFLHFARLLRADGFVVAPEQVSALMAGVTLLGPRSMDDIREAGLAALAPPPDRREAFEALFRAFFHGEDKITVEGGEEDEETVVKDDADVREEEIPVLRDEESGAAASALEQLGTRAFVSAAARLDAFRRALPAALPQRRSFRHVRTHAGGRLDLRRSLRAAVAADGDVPAPMLRRRQTVARPLLLLIDVSGSMKEHTQGYLKLAHTVVQACSRAEIFTFGTRLTRVTAALRIHDAEQALARAAALVDDWDGGTRIGPALLALLAIPRFAAFARGAAVIVLSDGLERGGHAEMELAMRRLAARSFRLSLATPLAGDLRFAPRTAALQAILPLLDDLVDGSSVEALAPFILSLARPAPAAATVWRRIA